MKKRFWLIIQILCFTSIYLQSIAQEDVINVGVYEDAPLVFKDTDGVIKGVYIDILEHIALQQGWKYNFVHKSFKENQEALKKGEIDILTAIAHTETRNKFYDFNKEAIVSNWGEIYIREDTNLRSILDLENKKVAVLAGDIYYESSHGLKLTAKEFDIDITFVEVDSYDDVLKMVSEKKVDAGLVARLHGTMQEEKYKVKGSPIVFHPIDLKFAFVKGKAKSKKLIKIIDTELSKMVSDPNSVYNQSLDRWLHQKVGNYWLWGLIKWIVIGAGILIAGFIALSFVLRRQVQKRTRQLYQKTLEVQELNENLEEKVIERTAEVNKQKEELIQINKQMRASIVYARNIQEAILPEEEKISKRLENYFILSLPRDIVSGDFHWFAHIEGKNLIAVADCTGHGVPGAFMSMLGKSSLDYIVHEKKIYEPADVLNALQEHVYRALGDNAKDGMDIAMCSFDFEAHKVFFAGAQRPLYFVRNGEINTIKGDRSPIGGSVKHYRKVRNFKNHEVDFEKGDMFYMTSDGFPDQFGGENNMKFTTKRMKALFAEVSKEEMPKQEQHIQETHLNWRADKKQIDDILVIGVRT